MADSIQPPRALRAPGRRCSRVASSRTRLALQAMRNSPATQASSSRDVVIVCTRWPVVASVFKDTAVRQLEWKGAAVAFISMVLVPLEISDVGTVLFLRQKGTPNPHSNLKSGKGAHSIAIN